MKKLVSLTLLMLALIGSAYAYNFAYQVNGQTLYFNRVTTTTVAVTHPNSSNYSGWSGYSMPYGDLAIPATVSDGSQTYQVVAIDDYAFYKCSDITSVVLPGSITSIGMWAFRNCETLTSIDLPTGLTTIGDLAFQSCYKLTSLQIPSGITAIPAAMCQFCFGLSNVYIPNTVSTISTAAFDCCIKLFNVNVPNTVTTIETAAFQYVRNLQYSGSATGNWGALCVNGVLDGDFVYTDNSRTTLAGCNATATSATIPSTVTTIGNDAFFECEELASVSIPTSVTTLGANAFHGCTSLASVTIPSSITIIPDLAFYECSGLAEIIIPNTVTFIGLNAFYECTGIPSINIPSSVTTIDNDAFYRVLNIVYTGTATGSPWGAKNVNRYVEGDLIYSDNTKTTLVGCATSATDVTIPSSVTTIVNGAFEYCRSLMSASLPSSLTFLGEDAFKGCENLRYISIMANTPPPASNKGVFTAGVPDDATVAVPCGKTSVYQSHSDWGYFSNFVETRSEQVNCLVSDDAAGSAFVVTPPNCATGEAVIAANANMGYFFSSWSDNSTDNPRTVAITSDTTFTAIFGAYPPLGPNDPQLGDTLTFVAGMNGTDEVLLYFVVTDPYAHYVTAVPQNPHSATASAYNVMPTGALTIPQTVPHAASGYDFTVTKIADAAFYECTGITAVSIPASVTSIGQFAFVEAGLLSITCLGQAAPTLDENAFATTNTSIPVNIPCGATASYAAAWTDFTNFVEPGPGFNYSVSTSDAAQGNAEITAEPTCADATITFSATPNPGYEFKKWSDDATDNPYTLTLTHDTNLTAIFTAHIPEVGDTIIYPTSNYNLYFVVTDADQHTVKEVPQYMVVGLNSPYQIMPTGDVAIPDVVTHQASGQQYNVTAIGEKSFYQCIGITSISMGNHVTSIENEAFSYCDHLQSITFSNSMQSIGALILIQSGQIASISLPASLTSLEPQTFYGSSISSMTIDPANTIYSMSGDFILSENGTKAFAYVGNSQQVTVPNGVTSLGDDIFWATSFTSITLPEGLTHIGNYAFSMNNGITQLEFPSSLTSIGFNAFYKLETYDPIETIICHSAVPPTLSNCVFDGEDNTSTTPINIELQVPCGSIPAYRAAAGWSRFSSIAQDPSCPLSVGDTIIVPQGSFSLYFVVIDADQHLLELVRQHDNDDLPYDIMPSGSITIPATINHDASNTDYTVVSIGRNAFKYCTGVTDVTLPNTITNISQESFMACTNLEEISTASSTTGSGSSPAGGNPSFALPSSVTTIGLCAFEACTGLTGLLTLPSSVTEIESRVFAGCTSITSVSLHDAITTIGRAAFYGCTGLTGALTIPNSVTEIGIDAFHYCTGISSITLSDNLTTIDTSVFIGCNSLTSLVIPNGVTEIKASAFAYCESLTSITLSETTSAIGNLAFFYCTNVGTINSLATTAPVLGTDAFTDVPTTATVNIPCGSTASYTTAWNNFSNFIEPDPEYTVTATSADETLGFATVTTQATCASNSVTVAATPYTGYQFVQWSDNSTDNPYTLTLTQNTTLTATFEPIPVVTGDTIIYPTGIMNGDDEVMLYFMVSDANLRKVNSIRQHPDDDNPYDVRPIGDIVIPDSVTHQLSGLKYVVTHIGDYTFEDCVGITSISMGDHVTNIGNGAFIDCSGLTSVTLPNSLAGIYYASFYGCSNLTEITLPSSLTSIGGIAFYGCTSLTEINSLATIPPTVGNDAFNNVPTAIPINVPCGSAGAYRAASGWNAFSNIQQPDADSVDVQVACDTYTWMDGNTYTASNDTATYTLVGVAPNGCDSVVTLNLTILNSTHNVTNDVACDLYEWNGQTYQQSDTYTFEYNSPDNGCPSVDTLHLTLNHSTAYTDQHNVCNSYTWIDGNTYTASNDTATHTLTNTQGCDSIVTLNLVVRNSSAGDTVAEACDSFTWYGETYTGNDTPTHTLTNTQGCDSTVTLTLTIKHSNSGTDIQEACDTYTWMDGNTYTASTDTATYTLTNVDGCDSVVTLNLTILNSTHNVTNDVACDLYEWNGQTYQQSDTYTFEYNSPDNGCPSIDTLHLTLNHSTAYTDQHNVCDSYTWIDGNTYTASNDTATHALTNTQGCDSIVTLNLVVRNSSVGDTVAEACETFTWYGETYTGNDTPTHTLTNAEGCDSIVTLHLAVYHSATSDTTVTACDSYTWRGTTYSQGGDYQSTHSIGTCVGTDNLHLTLKSSTHNVDADTVCDLYEWHGHQYQQSGQYTYEYIAENQCPSVDTLKLMVNHTTYYTDQQVACDSLVWHGRTFFDYDTATFLTTNLAGCDSIITLDMTLNFGTHTADSVEACALFEWIDTTYTESGTYTYEFENPDGCPSSETIMLTIFDNLGLRIDTTVCDGMVWNDELYEVSDTYYYEYENNDGCMVIDTLNLTVNYTTYFTDQQVACDSLVWHGRTFFEYDTATFHTTNLAGCDSIVTLDMTLHYSTHTTDSAAECDFYLWLDSLYAESGTYTNSYENQDGCPSTQTLVLEILQTPGISIDTTVCDSMEWYAERYDTTGIYFHEYQNANGCMVMDTLNLTVNYSTYFFDQQVACDSLVWHGRTFFDYDTATYHTTNLAGCDSTVSLELMLSFSTHEADAVTECDAYLWHGTAYSQNGTYTYDYENEDGCASTDTLHLTLFHSSTGITEDTLLCNNYQWHGVTYYSTGIYYDTVQNAVGCDSINTLNLTLLNGLEVLQGDTSIKREYSVQLQAWGSQHYLWSPRGELNNYTLDNPVATPSDTTLYQVTGYRLADNAANLVYNGDFELGNIGFLSRYLYEDSGRHNTYFIGTNTHSMWTNSNYTGNGKFMMVDVSDTANKIIWEQQVAVTPNTDYELSLKTLSVNQGRLRFTANGTDLMGTFYTGNGWEQQTAVWNSGNDTTATLRIFSPDNGPSGNDLGIDDIAMREIACITTREAMQINVDNYMVIDATAPQELGSVTGSGTYYYNTWVTVNATGNGTNAFLRWSDGNLDNPRSFYATCDTAFQAIFYDASAACAVRIDGHDNGCNGWQGNQLNIYHGDSLMYQFSVSSGCDYSWSYPLPYGDTNFFVWSNGSNRNQCSFEITTMDRTMLAYISDLGRIYCHDSALFAITDCQPIYYTLTASSSNDAMGSVTGGGQYVYGTPLSIEAIHAHGYYFDQWTDGNHNNPRGINVYSDTAFIATWSPCTTTYDTPDTVVALNCYSKEQYSFTASGNFVMNLYDRNACDSMVYLYLTIDSSSYQSFTQSACRSFTWHRDTLTASGSYQYHYTLSNGCASTDTLHLTIGYPGSHTDSVSACDRYLWNDSTYLLEGQYLYSYTTDLGCASTDTLLLTLRHSTDTVESVIACDSYLWRDSITYTASNDSALYIIENAAGCDSTITLHLTLHYNSDTTYQVDTCDSYLWNDSTYTYSGTYTYAYQNAAHCPSTDTLMLTIRNASRTIDLVTACDSLTWHGRTFWEYDTATYRTVNAVGCDSIVTLNLTLNHGTYLSTDTMACDRCTWNGTTYTIGGTFQYSYQNEEGCPSTDTLHLTMRYNSSTAYQQDVCDETYWNNEWYTESGLYLFSYTNFEGCPSTDTLHLTVRNSTSSTDYITACDSIVWQNGYTYTHSTEGPLFHTVNAAGCDSTITLSLTVNYRDSSYYSFVICPNSSYWLNDTTEYSTQGTFTWYGTTELGCDSIITVHIALRDTAECYFYLQVESDNRAMGTAEGSGWYWLEDEAVLEAFPQQGFAFDHWSDGSDENPHTVVLHNTWESYIAYFRLSGSRNFGIDDVPEQNILVGTEGLRIIVKGADDLPVTIYDLMGRRLYHGRNAEGLHTFAVPASGTYMVQAGPYPARRVVVIR